MGLERAELFRATPNSYGYLFDTRDEYCRPVVIRAAIGKASEELFLFTRGSAGIPTNNDFLFNLLCRGAAKKITVVFSLLANEMVSENDGLIASLEASSITTSPSCYAFD